MFFTAAIVLILLGAFLRGLHSMFYVAHVLLVCGLAYLYEQHRGVAGMFTPEALWVFFVLHTASITMVTFAAYGYDKAAARAGRWRVRERTLHALSFVGGTFGALAAQKFYRHKTRKTSFRIVFWFVALLQVALGCIFWVLSQ
jgi:uncharacterized membrane protein YsdA (DUF1294 family)